MLKLHQSSVTYREEILGGGKESRIALVFAVDQKFEQWRYQTLCFYKVIYLSLKFDIQGTHGPE